MPEFGARLPDHPAAEATVSRKKPGRHHASARVCGKFRQDQSAGGWEERHCLFKRDPWSAFDPAARPAANELSPLSLGLRRPATERTGRRKGPCGSTAESFLYMFAPARSVSLHSSESIMPGHSHPGCGISHKLGKKFSVAEDGVSRVPRAPARACHAPSASAAADPGYAGHCAPGAGSRRAPARSVRASPLRDGC